MLPLALDDRYQFRKVEEFLNEPKYAKPSVPTRWSSSSGSASITAPSPASTGSNLRGHYYNFFWRTRVQGPVTVRFEYRQANLGSYVQAKEVPYDHTKGTMETKFQVIGDDYIQDGRVIAWRALLISDGKIVGLTQSYLWD